MISKFWFPKTQLLKKKKKEKDLVSRSLDKTNNGKQPRRIFFKYVANVVAAAAFRTVYGNHAVFCVDFELI